MSAKITDSMDSICSLCSEEINIYAVGICQHPVCYKCSTRMRVLCEQMYCAICRGDMPKVIFTGTLYPFKSVETYHYPVNRKFKIYFENDEIQTTFYSLLEHRCVVCAEAKIFHQFNQFQDHMRKEHQLFACGLCLVNIKVFSHQRKFYDRKTLAEHRRIGDKDDKSHRGHPNCRFCDIRYFDKDELVRHLRKDHYFCHFCEADGISNEFYPDHDSMAAHYKEQHFLCEDGECLKQQFFTNAFSTDIDYKAHRASKHSKHLSKALTKAARTIDVEVNLVPRHQGRDREAKENRRGLGTGRGRMDRHKQREEAELQRALTASLNDEMRRQGHISVVNPELLNPQSVLKQSSNAKFEGQTQDFPNLEGDIASNSDSFDGDEKDTHKPDRDTLAKHVARASKFSVQDGSMADAEFPSLGGAKVKQQVAFGKWHSQHQTLHHSAPNSPQSRPRKAPNATSTWVPSQPPVQQTRLQQSTTLLMEDFPSLGAIGNMLIKPKQTATSESHSKDRKVSEWQTVTSGKLEPEAKPKKSKSKTKKKVTDSQPDFNSASRTETPPSRIVEVFSKDFPALSAQYPKRNEAPSRDVLSAQYPRKNEAPSRDVLSAQHPRKNEVPSRDVLSAQHPKKNEAPSRDVLSAQHPKKNEVPSKDVLSAQHPRKNEAPSRDVLSVQHPKKNEAPSRDVLSAQHPKKNEVPSRDVLSAQHPKKNEAPSKDVLSAQHPKRNEAAKGTGKIVGVIPARETGKNKVKKETDAEWQMVPGKVKHITEPQIVKTKEKASKEQKKLADSEDFPSLVKATVPMGNTWVSGDVLKSIERSEQWHEVPMSKAGKEQAGKKKKKSKSPVVIDDQDFPALGKATMAAPTTVWGPKEPAAKEASTKNEPKKESGIVKFKVKGKKKGTKGEAKHSPQLSESEESGSTKKPNDPVQNGIADRNLKVEAIIQEIANIESGDSKAVVSSKKKSSLSANMPKKTALVIDDFPTLNKPSAPPPPGFTQPAAKAPPGFACKKQIKASLPPPGFASVPSQQLLQVAVYNKPVSFSLRNQQLISTIQLLLDDDNAKFSIFKSLSGEFRQNSITASTYYARCCDLITTEKFHQVFPELLVLLPDIQKQQELLAAFKTDVDRKKDILKISRGGSQAPWCNSFKFHCCEVCGQILMGADILDHGEIHSIDSDFPLLGTAVTKGIVNMGSWG